MASRPSTARRRATAGRASRRAYKEDDPRCSSRSPVRCCSLISIWPELRYFEMSPGGFSTLERHEHMHAVLVLRGRGQCLVGDEVKPVETRDLVTVPAMTWHQFRATWGEPLGFLCMVNASRDKPQLPSAEDLAELERHAGIAAFLRSQPGS